MPIYKLRKHTASFHSRLQRHCRSEMKQEPLNRSTAVFDFDEEDPKPFADLFKASFNHKRTPYGKQLKHGKSLGTTSRKKRKVSMKRLMEITSKESVTSQEACGNWSSSASDMIEADDSDSESNQDRMQLDMRFGGARGVSCFNACRDEDHVAEKSRKVVVNGEVLSFLEQEYICPEFIFTADAILLKIQVNGAECIVKWLLHEIESFRSYSDGEGLASIELDLTKRGVETFRQELGQSDSYYSSHTLSSSISNINSSWGEDIKQITSLSDGYKSIWRPGKVQDLNNHESQHLPVDCIVQNRNRANLDDWSDLIFPTKEDHDAVTVTKYDYLLLNPDQFLSDTIIDFYIKYLQSLLSEDENKSFYFYNSFFFRKLTEMDKTFQHGLEKSKSSFERVKRWTARLNIFDRDYLFIPIMQSAHWSLVIVCHPGHLSAGCQDACDSKAPMILHFDSLEGCHTCVEEPIRNYLVEAWSERNGHNEDAEGLSALNFVVVKVPQQTNYSDCGLFLLHYVELFIKEVLEKDSIDFVTDEWFNPADASRKRTEIQSLIQNLKAKESTGKLKSQQHTPSCVLETPDGAQLAQRSVSFGNECYSALIKVTNLFPGNLYDQACNMFVSHPQLHRDNMQGCKLGHGHLELVEHSTVARELQQGFYHGLQQAPCGELSMRSLQQGAVKHVQDILMLDCRCSEENCIVHGRDHVLLNDSLDIAILSEDLKISHAQVGDVANEFAAGSGNGPTMAEENFIFAKPDRFASNIVDAKSGFAFCVHSDDKRVSDITTAPVQNFSLDEIPSACGFQNGSESHNDCKHSTSDETDSLAEDAAKSYSEHNGGIHGSDVSNSEPKDWLIDSAVDANDQLEGRKLSFMDWKHIVTQHKADDRCQAIDLECKGANSLVINEIGAANKSEGGRFLQNEDDSSESVIVEGSLSVSRELQTECKGAHTVPDNSSPPLKEERAGLGSPHYISSDEGLTPIAAKGIKEGKRGRGSSRRNAQHESKRILAPVNGRVTRSTSKKQI